MAIINILTEPNQLLREKAVTVTNINGGVLRVLDNMKETMAAANGVGLAAPQIGVLKRMVVVDVEGLQTELINPEIIYREGSQDGTEGCLSVPGFMGEVTRSYRVKVKYLDRAGQEQQLEAENHQARCLQHELDHLDGILYIDKANWVERDR